MIPYGNKSGNSGVIAYEAGKGFIKVQFADGTTYKYTQGSAGKNAIAEMIVLAKAGLGLSTYISQHVKDRYSEKR